MPTYKKRGNMWLAQVYRRNIRKAKSFPTKAQAQAWAGALEADIMSSHYCEITDRPVSDLLEKYALEVSPTKRGAKWETNRLTLLGRDPLAAVRLPLLDAPDIAKWRDRRLKTVSGSSVNREWNLLSGVFTTAINEWRMLEKHPMRGVKRPPKGKERDRLPTENEIEVLRHIMGDHGKTLVSETFLAFLFASETGMRCAEICKLSAVSGRVAYVRPAEGETYASKNGDDRNVALSPEALRIWNLLGPFKVTPTQVDSLWRKSTRKAGIIDLHFHDSRHVAITNLSKKLEVLELAKMVGTRNIKQLMTYYNPTAEDTAAKL